jgi:hypothetical protein
LHLLRLHERGCGGEGLNDFRLQPERTQYRREARYNVLVKRVRNAIEERTEVSGGFSFKLDSRSITLVEAAEWIGMEQLCCFVAPSSQLSFP